MMPATILIVDDALEELKPFIRFLEISGFRVAVAPDGESALNQIPHVHPDLILLDVLMPGLDGVETCRRLKAMASIRDIPVIFLTSLTDMVEKLKGFEAGGADYITKPIQQDEVLARIKTHLELRRLHQELQREHDRLRSLADAALEGIVVSVGEQILEVNQASEKLFGYPRADLLKQAISDLLTPAFRPLLTAPLPADPEPPQEAEGLTLHGTMIPIEIQIRAIDWQGQPARVAAIRDLRWRKALEHRQAELQKDRYKCGDLIGKSPAMQAVYAQLEQAAASESNVVILGESGTGKELAANTIHRLSSRNAGAFVPVNCGAVTDSIFEREFFGHRKGAFTGADRNQAGYLDQAQGGTLFLDEVGELTPTQQVKLLRVLESREYTPLGATTAKHLDARFIFATNRDLKALLKTGAIREDFYYRIRVIVLTMPPLRNRLEDLPLLVQHFEERYTGPKARAKIPGRIVELLGTHDWPGNIRELYNELERYLAGGRLEFLHVDEQYAEAESAPPLLTDILAEVEKQVIIKTLQQQHGNKKATAAALGIDRKALYNKLDKYGI